MLSRAMHPPLASISPSELDQQHPAHFLVKESGVSDGRVDPPTELLKHDTSVKQESLGAETGKFAPIRFSPDLRSI